MSTYIDRLNDDHPGWPIVIRAHEVGVQQAKDSVWRFAGLFGGIAGETYCNSNYCVPRSVSKALRQKKRDKLMPHRVLLSRERFKVGSHLVTLYLGQCRRCGFVYWGLPE